MFDVTLDAALKVANFIIAVGAMIVAFFATRRMKVDGQIEGLEKGHDELRQELVAIRSRIETLPSREELHELDRALAVNEQRLAGIEDTTQRTSRMVERIENFLLKIGGER